MKVLFFINSLNFGGAERMLSRLVVSKCFQQNEIKIVSLFGRGDFSNQLERAGINVIYLNVDSSRIGIFKAFHMLNVLNRFNPDVVHSWSYHTDLILGLLSPLVRVRSVFWSIRQTNLSSFHNKLTTLFVARICALLSRFVPYEIICNAHSAKKSHVSFGYKSDKIKVIQNGIDLESFAPSESLRKKFRGEIGISEDVPLIGMVGRFDSQKNHELFINAAKLISEIQPRCLFVLSGKEVDDENEILTEMISRRNLCSQTLLLGQRDDIPAVMNGIDVLISSSAGEGWPNVVGESMACGTPVVSTNVGEAEHIIGDSGITIETMDASALADGALEIISLDPPSYRELSGRARARICENFDIEKIAEQYHTAYVQAENRFRK